MDITNKLKAFGYYNEDAITAVCNYCEKQNLTDDFMKIKFVGQMSDFVTKAIRWQGSHGGFRGTTTADVLYNKRTPKSTLERKRRERDIMMGRFPL